MPSLRIDRLAPAFDHGAALARNLLDSEREKRLTTRDRNRTMAAFAGRGRSPFYASTNDVRPLELREAFRAFAGRAPDAARAWLGRLQAVNRDGIGRLLERIPAARMSEVCKRFTVELLLTGVALLCDGRGPARCGTAYLLAVPEVRTKPALGASAIQSVAGPASDGR